MKNMFYLMMHSADFIYSYMASNWVMETYKPHQNLKYGPWGRISVVFNQYIILIKYMFT